ncbi:MAG TPA: signal peptide peptidase SppA [Actinopolymorphaceae bacterium]
MSATLLELDLTIPPVEAPPADPLTAITARRRPVVREIVDGLRLAADDPEVIGLIAHVGGPGPSLAHAQEIALAVRRFAAAGKATIAWTETFGELGPATVPYVLGAAFDEVWLQPSGDVGLTGIVAEAVFLKDALAKLGVVPQLSARREYKNAADTFLADRMTDAHREAASRLAASAMEHVVSAVAEARSLDQGRVRELVDLAPLTADQAKEAGLVDRLGYRDEVFADLRRRFGQPQLRYLHRYRRHRLVQARTALERFRKRPAVAIVHGSGNIHLGRGQRRPMSSGSIGSETLGAALRAASADAAVRAVVLRVDSPGGSYVASDTIRREVQRVRASGRPVIVSMGPTAASGGYFVSMAADRIVALPGTLTGSIGVLGGKAVVRDILDKVGVRLDGVAEGTHARMFSSYQRFSDSEWDRLEEWLDHVYADFTAKVAADRSLSAEETEAVSKGRVWTGADARERGLVDELGGLDRALDLACAHVGLERDEIDVRVVPRLGFLERFRSPESSEDLPSAAASARGPGPLGLRGPLDWLTGLFGVPPAGVLTTPVLWNLR